MAVANFRKNPNQYFYRNVAPDETQHFAEWSEEEHERFMSTVRKYGAGDKWGLFSSYVRTRVGYQCSAYYREVILPKGLVLDSRFKMRRDGTAVYKPEKDK